MRSLLALVAGVLVTLSFSPFYWWPLLLPAFAVVYLLWRNASSGRAFYYGLLFGIGQFASGASWVYISIQSFGGMPPALAGVCVTGFVLLLSLFPALAGWLQAMFGRWGVISRMVFIIPVCYLVMEWLRGWMLTGFPWLTTGYALLDTPLSGLAPIGGVYMLSLLGLMTIGGMIVLLIDYELKTALIAILLATAWSGSWYLDQRAWSHVEGQPIKVAVIQNNVPLLDKWQVNRRADIIDEYLLRSSEHTDKDLIVWPEGAIPDYLENMPPAFWHRLKSHPADFVFGTLYRPEGDDRYYNSMIAVNHRVTVYSKQHLVPFGEFFPMQQQLDPILKYLTIPMADFTPWPDTQRPLEVAGVKAAASICYEDAFPQEWRNQVASSGILVNVSEDMWFGNSLAPHQRLQMARFRAREFERPMVRSSNNGLSSLIDWKGKIDVITPQFEKAVAVGIVQPRQGETPYARFGDLPTQVLSVFLLLSALLFGRRRLR